MIIPKYRPKENSEKLKYLPCEFCQSETIQTDLWKHHKSCPGRPEESKSDGPVKNAKLLLPVSANVSSGLNENILAKMRNDHLANTVKNDPLILEYGQRQFEKVGKHAHTHQYVSQSLRELARFKNEMNKIDSSIGTLSQCLSAYQWENVIKGVKAVSGYESENQTFNKPTLAQKIGQKLK